MPPPTPRQSNSRRALQAATAELEIVASDFLLQRCRVPSSVSVATSVLVVAITALAASGGHVFQFAQGAETSLLRMANVLIFTVPGVVVGAQLGPLLADRVSDRRMEIALGVLFTGTAALLLAESTLL